MADDPWTWSDGPSPYRSTPFQILDLDPTLRHRGQVRARIERRRKRIESAPDRFALFGRTLTPAELNRAEEALRDPAGRLNALLLTHHPERAAEPEPPPGLAADPPDVVAVPTRSFLLALLPPVGAGPATAEPERTRGEHR